MIITIIISSVFITTINCQLMFIWLNNQQFRCAQNTQNYQEAIRYQYLCISPLVRSCIVDTNVYSSRSSPIFLHHFCGFIDGQNALQSRTVWKIDLRPNIHIHFIKFLLWTNYWFCDFEFVRVYSNNKRNKFCGSRLPWVYDSSDTKVRVVLKTKRFASKKYELELQYYGAYVPQNNQQFVLFIKPSSTISTHLPNTKQNAFESFHFVSSRRLDILELAVMYICSQEQLVCYDGPGVKSPILQFTYNLSEQKYLSSTFQMVCKFTRANNTCSKVPHIHYHAFRAGDNQVKNLIHVTTTPNFGDSLHIDESDDGRTTKYIYFHHANIQAGLYILLRNVSFPYMLYEGKSCMYGGIYIVQTLSNKDSEILSLCTPATIDNSYMFSILIEDLKNVSIVIIYYGGYSTERILFYAKYAILFNSPYNQLTFKQTYKRENTLDITIPSLTDLMGTTSIKFSQLNLRKRYFINITLEKSDIIHLSFFGKYQRKLPCVNLTVFYSPQPSNIIGRQYDAEIINIQKVVIKWDVIRSIFINISTCSIFDVPVWELHITKARYVKSDADSTYYQFLPTDVLEVKIYYSSSTARAVVNMVKPTDVPPYAIWKVWIETCNNGTVSDVSLEVFFGPDQSSSIYYWNSFNNTDDVYISVGGAVNMLFESINSAACASQDSISVWFLRHFIYDDRKQKYIAGQTPQHSYFSFHNQR